MPGGIRMVVACRGDTLLAHVTDAHVAPFGKPKATLKHRSLDIFSDLVEQLNDNQVSCTLFGGDNIDNRADGGADLEAFLSFNEKLEAPWLCTYGNHESSKACRNRIEKREFAKAIDGRGVSPGHDNFSRVVGDVRVIGIDTSLEGLPGGYVQPETLTFLAKELSTVQEPNIVVMGHHPLYRAWEPYSLDSWDREYLVANRNEVIELLWSNPRVQAYLCGHHHTSRIQKVSPRRRKGGFYHILTSSPVAYPHAARLLRFGAEGIEVSSLVPRVPNLVDEGREAVLTGRKAQRYQTLGARQHFLQYVAGRRSDNEVLLPYTYRQSRQASQPQIRASVS